jgi:uncharacterized membrane protein YqjE
VCCVSQSVSLFTINLEETEKKAALYRLDMIAIFYYSFYIFLFLLILVLLGLTTWKLELIKKTKLLH